MEKSHRSRARDIFESLARLGVLAVTVASGCTMTQLMPVHSTFLGSVFVFAVEAAAADTGASCLEGGMVKEEDLTTETETTAIKIRMISETRSHYGHVIVKGGLGGR